MDALVARYEELRRHVLDQGGTESRLGLTLLLRQGLAAWSEAQRACSLPRVRAVESRSDDLLPDDARTEVVHVLTNMALSNLQEVRA